MSASDERQPPPAALLRAGCARAPVPACPARRAPGNLSPTPVRQRSTLQAWSVLCKRFANMLAYRRPRCVCSIEQSGDDYIPFSQRAEWQDISPIPQDDGPMPIVRIAYSKQCTCWAVELKGLWWSWRCGCAPTEHGVPYFLMFEARS